MTTETPEPTNRMGAATRERVREQLACGADDTDPSYFFSTTHTSLLLAVTGGLVDPVRLARAELANRGLDANGDWCGADRARQIHLGLAAADCTDIEPAKAAATEAARRFLHIETLDTRNADALDFHELSIWAIREALASAFEAGAASATKHTTTQED